MEKQITFRNQDMLNSKPGRAFDEWNRQYEWVGQGKHRQYVMGKWYHFLKSLPPINARRDLLQRRAMLPYTKKRRNVVIREKGKQIIKQNPTSILQWHFITRMNEGCLTKPDKGHLYPTYCHMEDTEIYLVRWLCHNENAKTIMHAKKWTSPP